MKKPFIIIAAFSIIAAALLLFGVFSGSGMEQSTFPHGVKYEVFVQSYADGNGDGIGDFIGLTEKLDYIQSLGVDGISLMPIMPSPSYHKYDVTDYYSVHPDYGTLEDFKEFIKQAHQRGIGVIMNMVINHTSTHHPWFIESAENPAGVFRDYYVWSNDTRVENQRQKRQSSAGSDNVYRWHKVAIDSLEERNKGYQYYGHLGSGMPDLNFDNDQVKEEIIRFTKFWLLEVGVDGLCLDAAQHIFDEERAGENSTFWTWYKSELVKMKPDVYLVGEVWSDSHEAAPYARGFNSLFNFELSQAILEVVRKEEDSLGFLRRYVAMQESLFAYNPKFMDATFLTNHDQNRVRSVLGDDLSKSKAAFAILLTLPGTPYIYYGEEIGMRGMKPDELIREPFLWSESSEKNPFQTYWERAIYSTDQYVDPVSVQEQDDYSILRFYQELIELRNSLAPLSYGAIEEYRTENASILAWIRRGYSEEKEERLLITHNISPYMQSVNILPEEGVSYRLLYSNAQQTNIEETSINLPPLSFAIIKMLSR